MELKARFVIFHVVAKPDHEKNKHRHDPMQSYSDAGITAFSCRH